MALALLCGCSSAPPPDALKYPPHLFEERRIQSRRFDTPDQSAMLAEVAGVLLDLGYALEVSNSRLGIIAATKRLRATDYAQIATSMALALLFDSPGDYDDNQRVVVSVSVNQSPDAADSIVVRLTIGRMVWNNRGKLTRSEALKQPALYEAFFARLEQAVNLEARSL